MFKFIEKWATIITGLVACTALALSVGFACIFWYRVATGQVDLWKLFF
jgi:hypothetical protein